MRPGRAAPAARPSRLRWTMHRRRITALAHMGALLTALLLPGAAPSDAGEPVPIPGGVFSPGPRSLHLMGLHVEPGTIGNFDGVVALAYLAGRATDGEGHRYRMANDMRVFQGDYVAADGSRHRGTFAFI